MTLDDIKDLKDKVYELEGLLELAQLREDKIDELEPLIRTRISGLLVEEKTASESASGNESYETPTTNESEDTRESTTTPREPADVFEAAKVCEPKKTYEAEKTSEAAGAGKTFEPKTVREVREVKEVKEVKEANKPAFCINDRFRFRRELFNGSDAEFAAAMNAVASMENYEEAEDYFLGELGWNPEDENVQDFLAIIEGYFEKA